MTDHDRGFDRLRQANPEPTRPIEDKPTAHEMLAAVRRRTPSPTPRPPRWRGLGVAVAAAVAVLVVAVPLVLFFSGDDEAGPVATQPPMPTTVPETMPPTTLFETTTPPELAPATQALIDEFVSTYNAGDTDAFAAFLHPDFERRIIVDRSPESTPLDTVLTLYEVGAALHTEITLHCTPGAGGAFCSPTRFDDLHRVLGIGPSEVIGWSLAFEDGQLRSWSETRPNRGTPYSDEAVGPFADWVVANTEIDDRTFEQSYFSGGSQTWVPREDIAADVAALVSQWAADLGR